MCQGRGIPECYSEPKYIPKVGEVCDYRFNMWADKSLWHTVKVTAVTDMNVIVVNRHGEHLLNKERFSFRKIQSEEEEFCTALESLLSPSSFKPYAIKDLSSCLYKHGFRYVGEEK